jgi:hypothetical protein
MRPLSLFATVGLTLIAMTSAADAAGRRTRYVTGIDAGPPNGGYYRIATRLTRYVPWHDFDVPYGGYHRTAYRVNMRLLPVSYAVEPSPYSPYNPY